MTRTRLGLLGLCAMIFGVMAVSAGSAQASLFQWLILDESGSNPTELKALLAGETDSEHLTLVTHLLSRTFWITCTNFKVEGVNLEAEGTLTSGGRVTFTGCEAYGSGPLTEPLGCNVNSPTTAPGSETVISEEGKGALLLHEFEVKGVKKTKLVTKIEPKTGELFADVETEECIMPEHNQVHGKLFIEDCLGQAETHAVKHLIEEEEVLTELWVGKKTAEHLETFIEGSAWVFLVGSHEGLAWDGMHNA